ncbi:energy transducer TonB [Limnohabitans sp. yimb22184]|uniref:energy transducer TonB n=1 Tax=Limnohabitans sp. YIMB22184 TaxID=3374104 RepID=UPI003A875A14
MKPVLRTSGAVLLAHAGVVWLVVHPLASPSLPGASDPVILASVVAEIPVAVAQPVQTTPTRPAQALAQRPAVQQTVTPEPQTAPREFAPATSAAPTPTAAAAPLTTGSARPASPAAQAVVLPSSDADYLNNPPPAYPRMSRRMGEQGTVLVRVFINAEGRAEKADIRTSSGYPRLDDAALETVQRWRYVPGQRAGQAEAMWFNVPIRFVLD